MNRVVIAGGRDFCDSERAYDFIDSVFKLKGENEYIILSGGSKGSDKIGEQYAKEYGYKIEYYYPEWEKYHRAAGPIRNKKMAESCDFLICFWDKKSKGTLSMIKAAEKYFS